MGLLCLLWTVSAQFSQVIPESQQYQVAGETLQPTSNQFIHINLTDSVELVSGSFSALRLQLRGNSGSFGIGFRANQDITMMWRLSGLPNNPMVHLCTMKATEVTCANPIAEFNPAQTRDIVVRVVVENELIQSELFLGAQRFATEFPESFLPDSGAFTFYFENARSMSVSRLAMANSGNIALQLFPDCISENEYAAIYRRVTGFSGPAPTREAGENGDCCEGIVLSSTEGLKCVELPVTQNFESEAVGNTYSYALSRPCSDGLEFDLMNIAGMSVVDSTSDSDGSIGFDATFRCNASLTFETKVEEIGVTNDGQTSGSNAYLLSGTGVVNLLFDSLDVTGVGALTVTLNAYVPYEFDVADWRESDFINILLHIDDTVEVMYHWYGDDPAYPLERGDLPESLSQDVPASAKTIQLEIEIGGNGVGGTEYLYIDNIVVNARERNL